MPTPARLTTAGTAALTATLALVALTGCTPGPTSTTAPSPTVIGTEAPEPAPSTTEGAAPTPADTPVECEGIRVGEGSSIDGASLGPCLQASIERHGSGVLTVSGDELGGRIEYHYEPAFEFRGELETGDGPVSISFVDDVIMVDSGTGPIVGDASSDDAEAQMAGVAGELYRVFSDPGFIDDLIRESENWTVTHDGESWRADSNAPFSWYGIPVAAYSAWFSDGWDPIAAESTSDFLGHTATIRQDFSALGEPVDIAPLADPQD